MTEMSMFPWETQTGTGDGVFSYNQDQANDYFRYFDLQDPTVEGVGLGVLNELEVVAADPNTINVDTGIGVCYGRYWNDAVVSFALADDVVVRGYNVVLQSDWANNETRLVLLSSVDATIPTPTQIAGTLWEVSLATFTKASGVAGIVTLVDTRVFLRSTRTTNTGNFIDSAVTTIKINDLAVTTAKIDNDAVTLDKVPDRTRSLFMPSFLGWDGVLPFAGAPVYSRGAIAYLAPIQVLSLPTAVDWYALGSGVIPYDMVLPSAGTLDVVVNIGRGGGVGNVVLETTISAIGNCAGGGFASATSGVQTIAVPATATANAQCIQSVSLAGWAGIGDEGGVINVWVKRTGTSVNDTHAFELDVIGFMLTYTADS